MLSPDHIKKIAADLEQARLTRHAIAPPSATHAALSIDDAYAIQEDGIQTRMSPGQTAVGYKVGLTTSSAQRGLGTDCPLYGVLLQDMVFAEGDLIPSSKFLAPRVEIELAFMMGKTVGADCSRQQLLDAVDWVAPATEIIDNRVTPHDDASGAARNALDIIADGGGSAALVVSSHCYDPKLLDLPRLGAVLTHNGENEDSGLFAVVLNSPENALIWLASELARKGKSLNAGDLVLCGSVIKPFPARGGDRFDLDYGPLGILRIEFM